MHHHIVLTCGYSSYHGRGFVRIETPNNFPISSTEDVIVDKRLSVRWLGLVGNLLLLIIREHCFLNY